MGPPREPSGAGKTVRWTVAFLFPPQLHLFAVLRNAMHKRKDFAERLMIPEQSSAAPIRFRTGAALSYL